MNNLEEIKEKKEELIKKFDGKLPSYLQEYFDKKEKDIVVSEQIRDLRSLKYTFSSEEKSKFISDKNKEFWENNKTEIIKSPKPIRKGTNANYSPVDGNLNKYKEEEVELSPEEIRLLVEMCETDLYLFAIRYFSHYLKKPSSSLHKFLYSTFQRELNKKGRKKGFKWAVAAPRGNAKSSILSIILPIWCICYNKKRFIITISNTAGLAEDFLTDIKMELETNSSLVRDFPHVCGKGPRWRANEIITNNDVKLLALGTGSQIRGRRFGIYRPDLILMDDLEDKDMVRSATTMDFIKNTWFAKDVMFAGGEEGSPVDFMVIGTILSKDSLLNTLMNPSVYPEWNSRRFKSIIKFSPSPLWDEWREIYTNPLDYERVKTAEDFYNEHKEEMLQNTEVLWPEGHSYYNLFIEYVKDISAFYSELQNDPADPTKILVSFNDLTFLDFRAPELQKMIRRCHYYGALDPSLGRKKTSGDYSCIITLGRDPKSGLLLVIDVDLKRRVVDDQVETILKKYEKFKYKLFGVETNAFQLVVAENLKKLSRQKGYYIPINELNNYNDKKMRIEGIVPLIKDKTIIFDKFKYNNNAQYRLGIEQLTTFVGDGSDAHDDMPDALEMAVRIARQLKFRRIAKSTR